MWVGDGWVTGGVTGARGVVWLFKIQIIDLFLIFFKFFRFSHFYFRILDRVLDGHGKASSFSNRFRKYSTVVYFEA